MCFLQDDKNAIERERHEGTVLSFLIPEIIAFIASTTTKTFSFIVIQDIQSCLLLCTLEDSALALYGIATKLSAMKAIIFLRIKFINLFLSL